MGQTDKSAVKLRRCPFCGCKPSLGKGCKRKADFKFIDGSVVKAGDWMWKPAVSCRKCGIRREFETVEEAQAWWNAEGIQQPAEVKA